MKESEKIRMNLHHIIDMAVHRAVSAMNLTDAEVKELLANEVFANLQQESTRRNIMAVIRKGADQETTRAVVAA